VEIDSLGDDTLVVPVLRLADLTLDIERNSEGTNYGIILDNLARFESPDTEPEEEPVEEPEDEDPGTSKRFLVKRISLENIAVQGNLLPAGGEWTKQRLEIPNIELRDVGTAENGATVSEIAEELITALLQATIEAGNGVVPEDLLQDVSARLDEIKGRAEALREDLEGRADELREDAEGKADAVLEQLQDRGDELKDQAGEKLEEKKSELEKRLGEGLQGLGGGGGDGDGDGQ